MSARAYASELAIVLTENYDFISKHISLLLFTKLISDNFKSNHAKIKQEKLAIQQFKEQVDESLKKRNKMIESKLGMKLVSVRT